MVTLAEATSGVGAGVGNVEKILQDPNADMKQEISISPVELRATQIAKHIELLKHIETQLAKYDGDTLTEEQAREIVQSLLVEIHGGKINIDQNTLQDTLQTNTGWRQWAWDRAGDIWRSGKNIYENIDHQGLNFLNHDQEDELLDNIFQGLGISQEDPRDPTKTLSRGVQMANLAQLMELAYLSSEGELQDNEDNPLTLPDSVAERLTYRNILSAIVTNSYVSLDGEFEGVATELEKLAKVGDPAELKFQDNTDAYTLLGELEAAYAVISTLNFNFSKLGEPYFGDSQATEEELDGLGDNSFEAVWKGGEGFQSRLNHLLGVEEEGVISSVERSNIGKIRNLEIISGIDESIPAGQQVGEDQDTETDEAETDTDSLEEGHEETEISSQGSSEVQGLSEEDSVEGSLLTLNLASIQTMLANGYIESYESYQQYYQQVEDDLAAYWKARSGKIKKINDEIIRINEENHAKNEEGEPPIYTVVGESLLLSTPEAADETVINTIGSITDKFNKYFADAIIKLNYVEILDQVESHSEAEASKLVPLPIVGTEEPATQAALPAATPAAAAAPNPPEAATPAVANQVMPFRVRESADPVAAVNPGNIAAQLPPVPQT